MADEPIPHHGMPDDLVTEQHPELYESFWKSAKKEVAAVNVLTSALDDLRDLGRSFDSIVVRIKKVGEDDFEIIDSAEALLNSVKTALEAIHEACTPLHKLDDLNKMIVAAEKKSKNLSPAEVIRLRDEIFDLTTDLETLKPQINALSVQLHNLMQAEVDTNTKLIASLNEVEPLIVQAHDKLVAIPRQYLKNG